MAQGAPEALADLMAVTSSETAAPLLTAGSWERSSATTRPGANAHNVSAQISKKARRAVGEEQGREVFIARNADNLQFIHENLPTSAEWWKIESIRSAR